MPAEAQHVRPGPQPEAVQLGVTAQLPAGSDEFAHMRRELVEVLQVVSDGQPPVKASAKALGGLGGVLSDVASHLLSRQLPRLVLPSGDVADVQLHTPPRIRGRPTINRRAGHPDGRDRLLEGVLEEGGGELLR
jgi:hypothetical protein